MVQINFLQVNVNRSRAAHDMITVLTRRLKTDLLLISEPNKSLLAKGGWIHDRATDAAILVLNPNITIKNIGTGSGFAWVELQNAVIFSVYASPNAPCEDFDDLLDRLEIVKRASDKEILICGDLNAKAAAWNRGDENARGLRLEEWIAANNLEVLNDEIKTPTWRRGISESVLDVTLGTSGIACKINNWCVLTREEIMSDHFAISFMLQDHPTNNYRIDASARPTSRKWLYSEERKLELELALDLKLREMSGRRAEDLTHAVQAACDLALPLVKLGRRRSVYWWSEKVAESHANCLKARRKLTRLRGRPTTLPEYQSKIENAEGDYRLAKKALRATIMQSKTQKWRDLCDDLDNDVWGDAYKLVRKKIGQPRPIIPEKVMERCVDQLFPNVPTVVHPQIAINTPVPKFSAAEIALAGDSLKPRKSPGPDCIPVEVVKMVAKFPTTLEVLNHELEAGRFPAVWKCARLALVPKPGKQQDDPTGYRPICLLDVLGKLYEHMVLSRLQAHLHKENILSERQYGFRAGHSTVDAIERVYKTADKAAAGTFRSRRIPAVVLLDVQNAFNSARWDRIVSALHAARVPKYLLKVLQDYLSSRTLIYGQKGDVREITCGVPQGSKLGPTLWNILYDGVLRIPLPKGVEAVAYADDLALIITAKNIQTVKRAAENAITKIAKWMSDSGLALAPAKTEFALLTGKRRGVHFNLEIQGHSVEPSRAVKYLGVWLDQNRTFIFHARKAAEKAERVAQSLARVMRNIGGPRARKRKMLASVVESVALYGCWSWRKALQYSTATKALQRTQRIAALRVTSAYRTVSAEAALAVAGMIPIDILAETRNPRVSVQEMKTEAWRKWEARWKSIPSQQNWTRRLIPDIRSWAERRHGEIGYFWTQFLTGHGSFRAYLHKFGRHADGRCETCGNWETALHAVFECSRFFLERKTWFEDMGEKITPENLTTEVLQSRKKWILTENFVRMVVSALN